MKRAVERLKRFPGKLTRLADRRLANKLILFITSILFVVITSLTIISYSIIRSDSVNASIQTGTNNLELVNNNFQNYFEETSRYSLPGSKYDNLIVSLNNEQNDYGSRQYLVNYVSSLFYSRDDIDSVDLYVIPQKVNFSINRLNYSGVQISYGYSITECDWFKKAEKLLDTYSIPLYLSGGENYAGGKNFLASYRVLVPIGQTAPLAAIVIHYNTSSAEKMWREVPYENGSYLFLTSKDGGLYYAAAGAQGVFRRLSQSNEYKRIGSAPQSGRFDWKYDGRRYLVLYNTSENEGCKLVKLIPYDVIYSSARAATNWCLVLGFIFLLFSSAAAFLIARAITKPVERLSQQMACFGEGNLNVGRLSIRGTNEIAQLERQFNHMVVRINSLINERYRNELIRKNAELKALEAEINPHFLYNALQAISTKALKSGAYDVSDMVCALAMSFRYCISGADVVTISDEITHIGNYLKLQKARFGDRLNVVYSIDDDMKGAEIPKLAIQTLVENSIKHGLDKMKSGITIKISVHEENEKAVVCVSDDGPGISPERLSEIEESLKNNVFGETQDERRGKSIGLRNLSGRLAIIFGKDARLRIENGEKGVKIYFCVPVNKKIEKGDEDDV